MIHRAPPVAVNSFPVGLSDQNIIRGTILTEAKQNQSYTAVERWCFVGKKLRFLDDKIFKAPNIEEGRWQLDFEDLRSPEAGQNIGCQVSTGVSHQQ